MINKLFHRRNQPGQAGQCSHCGAELKDHCRDLAFNEPAYWQFSDDPENQLDSDFCVMNLEDGRHYFVRGLLQIPIQGTDEVFGWGVWVSLSEKNFHRYQKVYGTRRELKEEPYFGWLSNELPGYADCLGLKTNVCLQGGHMRPHIVLDHEDPHPLCQDQHVGYTLDRVEALIKASREQS